MTREEQKQYNAENYPASVLSWLNESTDRAYDDFESRTCENCIHYKMNNGNCFNNEQDMYFGCNQYKRIKDD